VTYEELRDDLYEIVSKRRAKMLAFSMRQTKENVAANVYNRAFNTSYTFGDGQVLIGTAHPSQSGSPVEPSDDRGGFVGNLARGSDDPDHAGHQQSWPEDQPHAPVLHVSTQNWYEANRILKSVLQNDTANNAINVLKATNVFPKGIKLNHYFTSATAWFIRTNAPAGMKYYERDAVMFDQDNDFDTKNAKAACYERYSVGNSDWRGVYGTAGV